MDYVGHLAKGVKHLFERSTIKVTAIHYLMLQVLAWAIRVMQRVFMASACRFVGAAIDLQPANRADARNFHV
ncbi:hypothetical protein TSH100_03835 [Azospirillum sp. TSH100]|nr:hypothetical protein TSH100_03835 [Azospirillum sp. TSH100]